MINIGSRYNMDFEPAPHFVPAITYFISWLPVQNANCQSRPLDKVVEGEKGSRPEKYSLMDTWCDIQRLFLRMSFHEKKSKVEFVCLCVYQRI